MGLGKTAFSWPVLQRLVKRDGMTTGCNPVHILEHGDQNIIYKEDVRIGSLISNVCFI